MAKVEIGIGEIRTHLGNIQERMQVSITGEAFQPGDKDHFMLLDCKFTFVSDSPQMSTGLFQNNRPAIRPARKGFHTLQSIFYPRPRSTITVPSAQRARARPHDARSLRDMTRDAPAAERGGGQARLPPRRRRRRLAGPSQPRPPRLARPCGGGRAWGSRPEPAGA